VAEAEQAVGAHPLEVDRWSIRRGRRLAEEEVVEDLHHLRFIKVLGFLLDTFLPIFREVPVS
jgi:hypothetical protein